MIKSCFTDILPEFWRVPAGAARLSKETCPQFSESLTGARPLLASIRHGTRPERYRVAPPAHRQGYCMASQGSWQRYILGCVPINCFFFNKTHSVGDASCWQYNIPSPDGSFGPVVARNAEVLGLHLGRVGGSSSRLCIYIHISLCSKLFKSLECAVLPMVLCTIKNPWSYSIRV